MTSLLSRTDLPLAPAPAPNDFADEPAPRRARWFRSRTRMVAPDVHPLDTSLVAVLSRLR